MPRKKSSSLREFKHALEREEKFYSKLNLIRVLVRVTVSVLLALILFLFEVVNLDEMFLIFFGLLLVEFIRIRFLKKHHSKPDKTPPRE